MEFILSARHHGVSSPKEKMPIFEVAKNEIWGVLFLVTRRRSRCRRRSMRPLVMSMGTVRIGAAPNEPCWTRGYRSRTGMAFDHTRSYTGSDARQVVSCESNDRWRVAMGVAPRVFCVVASSCDSICLWNSRRRTGEMCTWEGSSTPRHRNSRAVRNVPFIRREYFLAVRE